MRYKLKGQGHNFGVYKNFFSELLELLIEGDLYDEKFAEKVYRKIEAIEGRTLDAIRKIEHPPPPPVLQRMTVEESYDEGKTWLVLNQQNVWMGKDYGR